MSWNIEVDFTEDNTIFINFLKLIFLNNILKKFDSGI